ncbi:MAG: SDR family oxidoreductase [Myxococcales bacterium]|nr:MAG: SDR family oxidoreductase [Myxococcales bacterium]
MDNSRSAVVQGASRGIGLEITRQLLRRDPGLRVWATCRAPEETEDLEDLAVSSAGRLTVLPLDVTDEDSVERAARRFGEATDRAHVVINVSGVLHGPRFRPEKKLDHVDSDALHAVFAVNAFGPLLVAKHFHRFLRHDERSVFASFSARVGSISDNRLGGWYAYRASKAAQNMITKTLSIELARVAPRAIVVGLHPGTVDTDLSRPFQRHVPKDRLLTPAASVASLLDVLDALSSEDSGRVFDFRGTEVPP